jgi:hypothetical protein
MLDEVTIDSVSELRREVGELRERVDALEHAQHEPCDEFLSTFQARELTGRSRQCVVNWLARFDLGYFDAERKRWAISRLKLIAFCKAHPGASRYVFW